MSYEGRARRTGLAPRTEGLGAPQSGGVSRVAGLRDWDHASATKACVQTNYERAFGAISPRAGQLVDL